MGHTLPTITDGFHRFLTYLTPYRRALRKSDQLAFDAMINEANQHLPAAGYAANVVPGITFLLSLALEKHKQAERHEAELEQIRADFRNELFKLQQEFAAQFGRLRAELVTLKAKEHEPD